MYPNAVKEKNSLWENDRWSVHLIREEKIKRQKQKYMPTSLKCISISMPFTLIALSCILLFLCYKIREVTFNGKFTACLFSQ